MAKRVNVPLVIAKASDGRDLYLYEGAEFPSGGLADGEAKRLAEFLEDEKQAADSDDGYDSQKVDDLRAEINRRNEGREEADLIPSDGKKAELVAALEADDNK